MTTTEERSRPEVASPSAGENVIYVGMDGSPTAEGAAIWAARDAHRRGAALCLVHVENLIVAGYAGEVVYPASIFDADRVWNQTVLTKVTDQITTTFPGLEVRTVVSPGAPVEVLRRLARHGLMTVVGSHGTHQFTDVTLGSIAAGSVTHGRGPVVVVRADPATGTVRGAGPVVVALDGLPDSDDALGFAFEEADLRGRVLVAVHTWNDAAFDGFAYTDPIEVNRTLIDDQETRLLAEQLAGWVDRYPDVMVTPVVLRGSPAATLLRYCSSEGHVQPELLVVGSRGRGGFAGLLLGSTSQALIAHAPCPVAVVRGRHDAASR
ncbi:MAG: universal stress protein [Nakamurella sp.]